MIKVNAKRPFCILPTLNIYRRGLEQKVFLHSITIFLTALSWMAPITYPKRSVLSFFGEIDHFLLHTLEYRAYNVPKSKMSRNLQKCRMQSTQMRVQMGYSPSKSRASSLFTHYHIPDIRLI